MTTNSWHYFSGIQLTILNAPDMGTNLHFSLEAFTPPKDDLGILKWSSTRAKRSIDIRSIYERKHKHRVVWQRDRRFSFIPMDNHNVVSMGFIWHVREKESSWYDARHGMALVRKRFRIAVYTHLRGFWASGSCESKHYHKQLLWFYRDREDLISWNVFWHGHFTR